MELEYHRKLEFPISNKFLYISEKVINCIFFFFKNSSIWPFWPRNGSFLQSLDYFWRPTCRTHSQQIILKEWTTLATWILDLLDFNSQRLNPSNRGGLDPTKIAALPSFAYLGDYVNSHQINDCVICLSESRIRTGSSRWFRFVSTCFIQIVFTSGFPRTWPAQFVDPGCDWWKKIYCEDGEPWFCEYRDAYMRLSEEDRSRKHKYKHFI